MNALHSIELSGHDQRQTRVLKLQTFEYIPYRTNELFLNIENDLRTFVTEYIEIRTCYGTSRQYSSPRKLPFRHLIETRDINVQTLYLLCPRCGLTIRMSYVNALLCHYLGIYHEVRNLNSD